MSSARTILHHRPSYRSLLVLAGITALGGSACSGSTGSDELPPADTGAVADTAVDVEVEDTAMSDSEVPDSSDADSSDPDTALADTEISDTGTLDTAAGDIGAADSTASDGAAPDTASADTSTSDSTVADTAPADTGGLDTGPLDTGPLDTGPLDTGADTGGSPVTGVAAYAWADKPGVTSYTANPANSYNASGLPISIQRTFTGTYLIKFNGLAPIDRNVQLTVIGSDASCQDNSVGTGDSVLVRCHDRSGIVKDASFTIVLLSKNVITNARPIAYAWANQPGLFASYTPPSSYNATGGAITAERTATGRYTVTFGGVDVGTSNIQISGAGYESPRCAIGGWSGSTVEVNCYDASNTPVDKAFTVSVFRKGVPSSAQVLGYAYADSPTATGPYYPPRSYAFNDGTFTAHRTGVGTYEMRLGGFSSLIGTSNIKVSKTINQGHCNVQGWSGKLPSEAVVYVRCYDEGGMLQDSRYQLLVIR